MKIRLGNFDFTEVWDGVLYKKLSCYPEITPWELSNLQDFMAYEASVGRSCEIEAEPCVKNRAEKAIYGDGIDRFAVKPERITECTACLHEGCLTDLVCHTASPENAKSILTSGEILSAVKARGLAASVLQKEARNAAGDPEDYFHYAMFAWGNCQAGDRLVMERTLGRFPNEEDLSLGFTPGVRFYFAYDRLARHPRAVFDGVLPVKVRDGVKLEDWVDTIVIPEAYREEFELLIPDGLCDRILYLSHEGLDIWHWSKKVYEAVRERSAAHD